MTIIAGLFLAVFGAAGAWFLSRRFPDATFLKFGYLLMSAGGLLFVGWKVTALLAVGVAGAGVLALGAIVGTIGALRKELRQTL